MDRKLKVYLDTSVISYLQQEDAPERMKDTLALWTQFEDRKYDICLSQVTLDEVGECREPKRTVLYEYLSRISYTKLEISPDFTVEDIHKIRERNYEVTKHMTTEEKLLYYNTPRTNAEEQIEMLRAKRN